MPDPENPPKLHRRSTRAVLGGLATGALLSAAAAGPMAAPAVAEPGPVRQQFDAAFTPGPLDLDGKGGAPIVVDVG